jgi:hypothetical protein
VPPAKRNLERREEDRKKSKEGGGADLWISYVRHITMKLNSFILTLKLER